MIFQAQEVTIKSLSGTGMINDPGFILIFYVIDYCNLRKITVFKPGRPLLQEDILNFSLRPAQSRSRLQ